MKDFLLGWLLKPQLQVSVLDKVIGFCELVFVVVIVASYFEYKNYKRIKEKKAQELRKGGA